MGKSDALSHRPDHGDGTNDNDNLILLKPDLFTIQALEGVTVTRAEVEIVAEIRAKTKVGVMENSVMKMVAGLKDSKADTVQGVEWNLQDRLVYYQDCIYIPEDKDL